MFNRVKFFRAAALCTTVAGLAACAHQPLEYIPAGDRVMLEAQARLTADSSASQTPAGGAVSVQQMLEQARSKGAPAGSLARVKLSFGASQTTLDGAMQSQIGQVAGAAQRAGSATVITLKDEGGGFTGTRRALSAATALRPSVGENVDVRYDPSLAAGEVIVVAGTMPQESKGE
jgi:hypothetical protein